MRAGGIAVILVLAGGVFGLTGLEPFNLGKIVLGSIIVVGGFVLGAVKYPR